MKCKDHIVCSCIQSDLAERLEVAERLLAIALRTLEKLSSEDLARSALARIERLKAVRSK